MQNDEPDATLWIIAVSFFSRSILHSRQMKWMQWICNILLTRVLWQSGIRGCTWQNWWHWLSTRDNFISESLRDLISCTRVLWHKLNASWTWVFFLLAAAECGHGKTKASSAGCHCCCICLFLDGRSIHSLLFGRLFCILLWSFHASCSETSLQRWFPTSEIGFGKDDESATSQSGFMRYSFLPQPTHLWFRLLIWDFFKNIYPALCSLAFSTQSFYSSSAEGLKCQMQMQLQKYLDPYCCLCFSPPFILSISCFQCASKLCTPLPVPQGTQRSGVTHFHHLCWLPCVTAAICLSTLPAAQRPHCVSHNKVFKFWVAACLTATMLKKRPNPKYLNFN